MECSHVVYGIAGSESAASNPNGIKQRRKVGEGTRSEWHIRGKDINGFDVFYELISKLTTALSSSSDEHKPPLRPALFALRNLPRA